MPTSSNKRTPVTHGNNTPQAADPAKNALARRVDETWYPLIAVATALEDHEWLAYAEGQKAKQVESIWRELAREDKLALLRGDWP